MGGRGALALRRRDGPDRCHSDLGEADRLRNDAAERRRGAGPGPGGTPASVIDSVPGQREMSRTRAQQRPRTEHGHQGRTSEEKPMSKYLLLKHYRGGPTPVVDFALIDQWTPDEVDAHMQFMGDFEARLRESGEFVDVQVLR